MLEKHTVVRPTKIKSEAGKCQGPVALRDKIDPGGAAPQNKQMETVMYKSVCNLYADFRDCRAH